MDNQINRREYFRIDDRVALRLDPVPVDFDENNLDWFNARRCDLGLVNHFAYNRESHSPQLKKIEAKHPEIAAYFKFLEEEIEVLAARVVGAESGMPTVPTHDVNICAAGFAVETREPLPVGTRYEVSLMLFPSRVCIFAIGEVLRSDEITCGDEFLIGHFDTVVRFTRIHDEDAEALVKHVHHVQLLQLQEKQETSILRS